MSAVASICWALGVADLLFAAQPLRRVYDTSTMVIEAGIPASIRCPI